MSSLLQSLKPYWDISFNCSRSYRWVMSIVTALYFLSFLVMMQSMFRSESNQMLPALIFRACVEAGIFFISCHFFLRPYLKLYLLPQNRFGWNLLQFLCFAFVLGLVMIMLVMQLAQLSPFGNFDFSNINIQHPDDPQKDMIMNLTAPTLILMGAINMTLMYCIWSLAYLFWHTLVSKKQIQRQMREAQMQQLTNQLNPHFLFNALNSIRALIFEDQHKAAHTLTQLSELFRVHLQTHLKPVSTLEDEWQIARRYLEIEQVRLEQRLHLELELDDSLWQQQLPTLTLLTLVENAIKHGINPSQKHGVVEIISRQLDKKRWQLCVNNTLEGETSAQGTQTGLANLQQRLHLLSPLHKLSYRKSPGRFEVTIEMAMELVMEPGDDQDINR
ncbi:sensor histidine kinase [Cellvibrio sp. pealriver]|uniref:sensor histidine kinase n=1 Tax=Cellvibrio sp. pealriver TaxID=1622269 RepID=UPI00066FE3F4|nr:histidine kinase [Cellvibrio sp. pealriver]